MYDCLLVPSYINSIMSLFINIRHFFQLRFHYRTCKAASTFQCCLFSPTGFPCWKDWWYTHVYCNHIPFQTHATFCCQCFSVADLLDLIFKQNCTNLPSTVSHTPTPVRAVLTSDNINNVCQGSLSDVSQRGWETVNTVCRKSF